MANKDTKNQGDGNNRGPDAASPLDAHQRGHASAAAARATERTSSSLHLPVIGTVRLPSTSQLAFLGGLGLLAAADVIEWPVALAVGVGHALITNRGNRVVREFGEALEEA